MNFFKTNVLTLFSKIICLASSLFISIYIARILGPSVKGAYYLLIQTVLILATISLFGIDSAVIYYLGKKRYSGKHIAITSNFITLFASLLITALLLGFHKVSFLTNKLPELRFSYLFIIALAMPFINIVRLNSATLMGFNKFISFNILNIAVFAVMVLNFIIFVVILKMAFFGALLSFLLSYLIMSAIYLIVIFRSNEIHGYDRKFSEKINVTTLLNYGTKFFLVPVLLLILYRIDTFFLSYYSAMSVVGVYSVALSFAELLLFIPESTGTILYPKLAYLQKIDANKRFLFILRMSMSLTFGVTVIFFITIRYLLPMVYGVAYNDSIELTYLLLPGIVAISSLYLFSSYFQAIGKPIIITVVLFIVLIVKAGLSYLLIPIMGSSGAAIATTLSYLFCFLIFLVIFVIKTRFQLKEIFLFKSSDFSILKNSINDLIHF